MTLLIGKNNAGKTSAYAPLLLLKQTLDARNPETALLFRGELVDFGSYKEVVTDHDTDRHLSMFLDFGPAPALSRRQQGYEDFPAPEALEVTFANSAEHPATLLKSTVFDSNEKPVITRSLNSRGTYRVTSQLLPANSEVGRPISEVTQLRRALQAESPSGFFFSGVGGLRLPAAWRRDQERWSKVQNWYRACSDLYDIYQVANYTVSRALRGISYIGPLRSAPQRSYLLSAEAPDEVGRDGQWASEILYQSARHDSDTIGQTNYWLGRLGYGSLDFEFAADYFQVLVQKPGSNVRVNLADCGVGLSQLLPLIVQGCVMEDGDTLIAQQPEIHLNPAQQDVMTDFLVDLCMSGKRVIVETHSEHVLTRIRRHVAGGDTIKNEDLALYYSESHRDRSRLRRIGLTDFGEFEPDEWPEGFFGEQLNNAMEMAISQSRRRRLAATGKGGK